MRSSTSSVGGGPAGEVIAGRCADAGLRVALVERELVGGECTYWACIPSKTLVRPGDVIAAARRVPGASEAVTGRIDVEAALAHRDYMTSNWHDEGQLPWLDEHKITLVRGSGRIDGERMVIVETPDNGTRRLSVVQAVVLATGTSARCCRSKDWPRLDHGPTGTSPAPRSCRGDSSSLEAARSGSRWPRVFAVSAARRSLSWNGSRDCLPGRSRSPVTRCAWLLRPRASPS